MKRIFCLIVCVLFVLGATAYASGEEEGGKKMKPALLVIDIQNQYLEYTDDDDREIPMYMINAAIALFREHGLPVIRVYHTNPEYGPEPGSEEFAFPESVVIEESDPKIVKNFPSAFTKTDLDKLLKEKECNTLYLCGLSAVGCVFATYHGAMEREYDVFMVKNALLSHKEEYTDMIEDITGAVSYTVLKAMLEYTQE